MEGSRVRLVRLEFVLSFAFTFTFTFTFQFQFSHFRLSSSCCCCCRYLTVQSELLIEVSDTGIGFVFHQSCSFLILDWAAAASADAAAAAAAAIGVWLYSCWLRLVTQELVGVWIGFVCFHQSCSFLISDRSCWCLSCWFPNQPLLPPLLFVRKGSLPPNTTKVLKYRSNMLASGRKLVWTQTVM